MASEVIAYEAMVFKAMEAAAFATTVDEMIEVIVDEKCR